MNNNEFGSTPIIEATTHDHLTPGDLIRWSNGGKEYVGYLASRDKNVSQCVEATGHVHHDVFNHLVSSR